MLWRISIMDIYDFDWGREVRRIHKLIFGPKIRL